MPAGVVACLQATAQWEGEKLRLKTDKARGRCNELTTDGTTWSLRDPLKMGSLPKIKGAWTHFQRVMETPGIPVFGF